MNKLPKDVLIWIVVIAGKILLAMTVYQLNKINSNLEQLNNSVGSLYRISDKLDVRLTIIETRTSVNEFNIKEINNELKEVYKERGK